MRRIGWSGFQGSLRSPWKARFARFARYNYKFSLGKEDFISDLNISQVGNFSLTANYTILTEEFCLNSFWVLMLIETLLILFFKCFVNPSTFQRQTFLENLTHSLGNCQIPLPIEDWDQTQGSIQSYKKAQRKVEHEIGSTFFGFLLKNFCGLDQLWFGSIFLDFSISGFFLKNFLKNFCGLEFQSKRISIFLHFWIFLKELLWFGFFKKILLLKKF